MRTLTWWLTGSFATLVTLGCSGSGSPLAPANPSGTLVPTPVAALSASGALGSPVITGDLSTSALAIYTLHVDPATLSATSSLKQTRTGQANDDLYLLPIDSFLRADSLRIRGVEATADTIDVTYTIEHPFPAPNNPTGTPNGSTNRADLGITGMALVLADVASATGNTYFTDRVANTALIANADAYYSPGGLLSVTGIANTFPYKQLVDELAGGTGSRVGQSNGGDVTGNFGTDGWTRAEFGPTNDGWTGYGALHQGQTSSMEFSLNKAAMTSGVDLDIAIIAKYGDPRNGANGTQKKANRLPPATADASLFAYRMPHNALDVSRIVLADAPAGAFLPNAISSATLAFHLEDADARATETSAADLSEDTSFNTVAVGESGTPTLEVCLPGLLGSAGDVADMSTVVDDDSAFGGDADSDSGLPGDALFYQETVSKTAGSGQTVGEYTGMVRATDPEVGLIVGLDASLAPLPSPPESKTYQAFTIFVGSPNTPPTATYSITNATVSSGGTATIDVTSIVDADNDPILVEVDWDNNGSFDAAGTVNSPYPANNPFTSPVTYSVTGCGPTNITIPCRISDGVAPAVDLLPSDTVDVVKSGWAYTTLATNTGLDQANTVAVDANGNVYIGGQFNNSCDFGGGMRIATGISQDIFLIKLDANGAYVWDRTVGSTTTNYNDLLTCVTVDPAGNPLIMIHWAGILPLSTLGGTDQTSNATKAAGNFDMGVARLDQTNGNILGLYRTNSESNETRFNGAIHSHSLDVNAAGEIIFGAVATTGTGVVLPVLMDFGAPTTPYSMTVAGELKPYLVKLSNATSPAPIWASYLGTNAGSTLTKGVTAAYFEPGGDVIVNGLYPHNWDFGGGARPAVSGSVTAVDVFVARRAGATGAHVWDRTFGSLTGTATEFLAGGDTDGTNIYVGGQFNTSIQWPAGPNDIAVGSYDSFVAAFSLATGNFVWRNLYAGTDTLYGDIMRDITVFGSDVYAVGEFAGSVNFGGGARTTVGSQRDACLVKMSNAGAYTYDKVWGTTTTGADVFFGTAMDNCGNPVMAGVYAGTIDVDPGPGVVNRTAGAGNDVLCLLLQGSTGNF